MVGVALRYRPSDDAGRRQVGQRQHAYNISVRGRYQIVISARSGSTSGQPDNFWARLNALLIGVGFLIVAVGVLVVALIFGSILAAVLWICLVVLIGALILKTTWRRLKGGQRQSARTREPMSTVEKKL